MTEDEMIEVLQAYKEGKQIEMFVDIAREWQIVEFPLWNFAKCKYRVKKNPTNLEIMNKMLKEIFGVDDVYTTESCPFFYKYKNKIWSCDKDCSNCKKWWDEEYKGVVNND